MTLRWTLRSQLLAWVLVCTTTVAIIFIGLIWREQRSFAAMREQGNDLVLELVRDGLQQRGSALASQLANAVANPLYFLDLDRIGEYTRNTGQQADVTYVLVVDAQGRIVHDGSRDIARFGEALDDLAVESRVRASTSGRSNAVTLQWSQGLLHVTAPVLLGEQIIGRVRIGLSMDEGQRTAQAWGATVEAGLSQTRVSHVRWLLLGLALITLFGLIGLFFLRRNVLKPRRGVMPRRVDWKHGMTRLAICPECSRAWQIPWSAMSVRFGVSLTRIRSQASAIACPWASRWNRAC
jgi:hypothetical protein